MKLYFTRTPRELLQAMVDRATTLRYCFDKMPIHLTKPGDMIKELSEEERKAIQKLTSEDAANTRWPNP